MNMNIEIVEWVDSTGVHGWQKATEMREVEMLSPTTIGFVFHETDAALYLTPTHDGQEGDALRVDDTIIIPKVSILSRRIIDVATAPQPGD